MLHNHLRTITLIAAMTSAAFTTSTAVGQDSPSTHLPSIQSFGVLPSNSPAVNKVNLQKAIDWAHPRGAALFVEPSGHSAGLHNDVIRAWGA